MTAHPDYGSYKRIGVKELNELTQDELLYSYIIIHADFEFPIDTKFPLNTLFVCARSVLKQQEFVRKRVVQCSLCAENAP